MVAADVCVAAVAVVAVVPVVAIAVVVLVVAVMAALADVFESDLVASVAISASRAASVGCAVADVLRIDVI